MKIENIQLHSFVPSMLKSASVAVDCGTNTGEFSRWLSDNTPAQTYAFEPDPRLFGKLPDIDRVEWIEKAIDGESGECVLALGDQKCSSAVYREKTDQETVNVGKISLDDFCEARGIAEIDLVKVDIEGAELNLLEKTSDRTLRATRQLTVEFHDFLEPNDIPRIEAIFQRMKNLGFFCVRFSHYTWGDCLFLNTAKVPLSGFQKSRIVAAKYRAGLIRSILKRFGR